MENNVQKTSTPPAAAIIRHSFSRPAKMNWIWPLMVMSLVLAAFYALRCALTDAALPFTVTSVTGYSIIVITLTLFAEVFPAVSLSEGFSERITGAYTGFGALILSFLSGVPIMMISIALYNFTAWFDLRLTGKSVYPVFFHYGQIATASGNILVFLSDCIIPGLGAAIFFFGFMWTRFRSTDTRKAAIVISLAYMLYSLNFTAAMSFLVTGVWCCYLRKRMHNIWGPFLCIVGSSLSEYLLPETLSRIDIFGISTYADISATYFYSSLPAFFMGVVLLLFFIRIFDSFAGSVRYEIDESVYDTTIPPFERSINLALITTALIFIVLWILVIKGVHL